MDCQGTNKCLIQKDLSSAAVEIVTELASHWDVGAQGCHLDTAVVFDHTFISSKTRRLLCKSVIMPGVEICRHCAAGVKVTK